jgi:zinc-finger-containing domain
MKVVCPYCDQEAKLVMGSVIYPHRPDLRERYFWQCAPCDAYVGTHIGSADHKPFGRLCNANLRKLRQAVHREFDPIWRGGGVSRSHAYQWLAAMLGISPADCHIGDFDDAMCERALEALTRLYIQIKERHVQLKTGMEVRYG